MSEAYSYRNLELWDRAQELTLAIVRLISPLPRTPVNNIITYQIIRSSSSIGANTAEGHGRYMPRAHLNHLSIAKGSTTETDSWLDLLRRNGSITREQEEPLHRECMELVAMLTAKIRTLERIAEGAGGARIRESELDWEFTEESVEQQLQEAPGS